MEILPNVLAIVPGIPAALRGRTMLSERYSLEVCDTSVEPLAAVQGRPYDLLVIVTGDVNAQQALASEFQQVRRWRLVPVLYVSDEGQRGFPVPGAFRPEMDGLVLGSLHSAPVQRRIQEMARDGASTVEPVVAGGYELDQLRGRLRFRKSEVLLTEREAEIVSILLAHSDRTVAASEIIERGWGAQTDDRYLQIVRRHISNIRHKLARTSASRALQTVRGDGYRFDARSV